MGAHPAFAVVGMIGRSALGFGVSVNPGGGGVNVSPGGGAIGCAGLFGGALVDDVPDDDAPERVLS